MTQNKEKHYHIRPMFQFGLIIFHYFVQKAHNALNVIVYICYCFMGNVVMIYMLGHLGNQ